MVYNGTFVLHVLYVMKVFGGNLQYGPEERLKESCEDLGLFIQCPTHLDKPPSTNTDYAVSTWPSFFPFFFFKQNLSWAVGWRWFKAKLRSASEMCEKADLFLTCQTGNVNVKARPVVPLFLMKSFCKTPLNQTKGPQDQQNGPVKFNELLAAKCQLTI